jgi:hypothetical protein
MVIRRIFHENHGFLDAENFQEIGIESLFL